MGNQDDFKEFGFESKKNLMTIAAADKLNEWVYQQALPHCDGEIIEIGSDIGTMSYFFFAIAGIIDWFFAGSVLKKKLIPESNMKLYNALTPLF